MPASGVFKIKCVSFDLQPSVQDTLHWVDYTQEEADQYWYGNLEMEAMIAAAMDPANERNLDVNGGSRGLEKYTTAGSTRLEVHRVQVVAAVLREQKRQARWRRKSPELIAKAASRISQECQELAYIQGFNDEMEAYAGNGVTCQRDVVSLPKPGLFQGFARQVRAISDLAFLERQSSRTGSK